METFLVDTATILLGLITVAIIVFTLAFTTDKFSKPGVGAEPFRDLTSVEKETFAGILREADVVKRNFKLAVISSVVIDTALFFIILFMATSRVSWGQYLAIYGLLPLLIIAIIKEGGILNLAYTFKNYQKDLADNVYRTTGVVSLGEDYLGSKSPKIFLGYHLSVNNYTFGIDEAVFQAFKSGDTVTVEFSPRSKTLWKAYKTYINP